MSMLNSVSFFLILCKNWLQDLSFVCTVLNARKFYLLLCVALCLFSLWLCVLWSPSVCELDALLAFVVFFRFRSSRLFLVCFLLISFSCFCCGHLRFCFGFDFIVSMYFIDFVTFSFHISGLVRLCFFITI